MISIGITGVREKIRNGAYNHKLKYPKKDVEKMKDTYVTNENKSVKWNREQVEMNKQKYKQELDAFVQEGKDLRDLFFKDLLGVLMVGFEFTEKASNYLLNKAWDEGHSEGLESVVQELADLIEIVQDFNKYNKS